MSVSLCLCLVVVLFGFFCQLDTMCFNPLYKKAGFHIAGGEHSPASTQEEEKDHPAHYGWGQRLSSGTVKDIVSVRRAELGIHACTAYISVMRFWKKTTTAQVQRVCAVGLVSVWKRRCCVKNPQKCCRGSDALQRKMLKICQDWTGWVAALAGLCRWGGAVFSENGYDKNRDSHGENSAPDLNRTAQREIHIQA